MTGRLKDKQADKWISLLNLIPHPEGGFYSETYFSEDKCVLERINNQTQACSGSIYYLLRSPESPRSHFHRIKYDEQWHFYAGVPIIIHELDEETLSHTQYILSQDLTVSEDARPQILIRHGKWFAAELMASDTQDSDDIYALCGCTCTPAFSYDGYEIAKQSYLLKKFPHLKELICRLAYSDN